MSKKPVEKCINGKHHKWEKGMFLYTWHRWCRYCGAIGDVNVFNSGTKIIARTTMANKISKQEG